MTEQPGTDGDRWVEISRDGPEDRDDDHQDRSGCYGVLEKLESYIIGAEALGHNPGANHPNK